MYTFCMCVLFFPGCNVLVSSFAKLSIQIQPHAQKSWDAVQNVTKNRMQWFANHLNPYLIENKTMTT